jgi:GDP-4-dehydro-6-deoxy-D-mannose reductase
VLLATGAGGFVGRHLVARARERGLDVRTVDGDLRDPAVARGAADGVTAVVHLASARRTARGADLVAEDLRIAVNVLDAVDAPVLIPGSAAEYGMGSPDPLPESAPLAPVGAYGQAKAELEAELAPRPNVIWTRSFNHVGPGQGDDAPVAAWARQVVDAERRGGGTVTTGSLSPVRDFLDVRDVADAYLDLIDAGQPGVVNVGSGRGTSLQEVADALVAAARVPVELAVDPSLVRSNDPPVVVADVTRLRSLTGFEPRYDLATSIADTLAELRG